MQIYKYSGVIRFGSYLSNGNSMSKTENFGSWGAMRVGAKKKTH